MLQTQCGRAAVLFIVGLVAACGQAPPTAAVTPAAATPNLQSASPSAGATPSPSPSPAPVSADIRVVISDIAHNQVRLARLDATDTATVTGQFDGVVAGQVIVVNGRNLLALSSRGAVKTLGHLAGDPAATGLAGSVAVSPDLSRWIYTTADANWTSTIHLGTPSGETVLAIVPSPDGYDFYQPLTWNSSGVYLVKQGTGLGGAGPFLEYHFQLARLEVPSGVITVVSPACVVEQVLDDGTMLCRNATGGVEVRLPQGAVRAVQVSTGTSGADGVFTRLTLAPDQRHMVAVRNGSTDPVINYQMVVADLSPSGAGAAAFGPKDYWPDAWLPDGRVVADHLCLPAEWGGGSCDTKLDGTYIFSADGSTHSLFYRLSAPSSVVAAV